MGQRHGIYVFVKNSDTGKTVGAGLYHQWLYGKKAGLQAIRVMEYQKKAKDDKYHPINGYFMDDTRLARIMESLYMTNPETGYWTDGVSILDAGWNDGVKDPRTIDNNDGITVFDFTDPKNPTCCFMNIGNQERGANASDAYALPSWTPVSVEAYMRAYYPVNGTEYQRKNWTPKNFAGNEKEMAKTFKRAKGFKLMTKARIKELFPAVFKKSKVKPTTVENQVKAAKLLAAANSK